MVGQNSTHFPALYGYDATGDTASLTTTVQRPYKVGFGDNVDPETRNDRLPQPFRMIDVVLNGIIELAWEQCDARDKNRAELLKLQRKVDIACAGPSISLGGDIDTQAVCVAYTKSSMGGLAVVGTVKGSCYVVDMTDHAVLEEPLDIGDGQVTALAFGGVDTVTENLAMPEGADESQPDTLVRQRHVLAAASGNKIKIYTVILDNLNDSERQNAHWHQIRTITLPGDAAVAVARSLSVSLCNSYVAIGMLDGSLLVCKVPEYTRNVEEGSTGDEVTAEGDEVVLRVEPRKVDLPNTEPPVVNEDGTVTPVEVQTAMPLCHSFVSLPYAERAIKEADIIPGQDSSSKRKVAPIQQTETLVKLSHKSQSLLLHWEGSNRIDRYMITPAGQSSASDLRFAVRQHILPYNVTASAISPSFTSYAIGLDDGSIIIYNQTLGTERRLLEKHHSTVTHMSFYQDDYLVASCVDEAIHIYDMKTGELLHRRRDGPEGVPVRFVGCFPDVPLLLAGLDDNSLRLYTIAEGRLLAGLRDDEVAQDVACGFEPGELPVEHRWQLVLHGCIGMQGEQVTVLQQLWHHEVPLPPPEVPEEGGEAPPTPPEPQAPALEKTRLSVFHLTNIVPIIYPHLESRLVNQPELVKELLLRELKKSEVTMVPLKTDEAVPVSAPVSGRTSISRASHGASSGGRRPSAGDGVLKSFTVSAAPVQEAAPKVVNNTFADPQARVLSLLGRQAENRAVREERAQRRKEEIRQDLEVKADEYKTMVRELSMQRSRGTRSRTRPK